MCWGGGCQGPGVPVMHRDGVAVRVHWRLLPWAIGGHVSCPFPPVASCVPRGVSVFPSPLPHGEDMNTEGGGKDLRCLQYENRHFLLEQEVAWMWVSQWEQAVLSGLWEASSCGHSTERACVPPSPFSLQAPGSLWLEVCLGGEAVFPRAAGGSWVSRSCLGGIG